MARNFSKRLVIDASVARAAGETDHPVSKRCRDALQAVMDICHRLVWTPQIQAEWERHESNFAKSWRAFMVRKGKLDWLDHPEDEALRQQLRGLPVKERQRQIMEKDLHLVEAACQTDRIVLSLDKRARRQFAEACQHLKSLKNVVWVNVEQVEEDCEGWLKEGAKPEVPRQLQNYQTS
jgi:hypothetical protein